MLVALLKAPYYAANMRVTGGACTGRRLRVPGTGVRPTTDRTREALFAILATRVPGARVLDLFAGSGAIGIEAWSRGARCIYWVESDRRALNMLRDNAASLGVANARVYAADVVRQLKKGFDGEQFEIIFADPPYEWDGKRAGNRASNRKEDGAGACSLLAETVRANRLLVTGGVLVIERGADAPEEECAGWRLIDRRKYGKTKLLFYCEENP